MVGALRGYLAYMATGMLAAAALHTFHPSFARRRTEWPFAAGWQREIAIWDATMGMYLLTLLRRDDAGSARGIAPAMMALNVQFAMNHLAAAYRGNAVAFHYLWAGLNMAGLTLGERALRQSSDALRPAHNN